MPRSKPASTPRTPPEHIFVALAGAAGRDAGLIAERDPALTLDEPTLRLREQLFRHIISSLGIGVVLLDAKNQILVCNSAAHELLGLSEE
jgi:PAS domain-containing protein